jgi:hypothetical protein
VGALCGQDYGRFDADAARPVWCRCPGGSGRHSTPPDDEVAGTKRIAGTRLYYEFVVKRNASMTGIVDEDLELGNGAA